MLYSHGAGWRSAVGRRPNIHVDVLHPTTNTDSASDSAAGYTSFDITIDRFGQEEDVTGASFAEPIGQLVERHGDSPSRSISKQSDWATRLSNSFKRQRATAARGERSYKLGAYA